MRRVLSDHLYVGVGALAVTIAAACNNNNPGTGSAATTGSTSTSGSSTSSATTSSVSTGGAAANSTNGTSGTGATGTGGMGGAGGSSATFVEKQLTVTLALSTVDTSDAGADAGAPSTVLTITATDGTTPVMTDAWLYTLESGVLTPLTGFVDPDSKRKYRGLLLPCTIAGSPSGLAPCDNGDLNGVLTDKARKKFVNGQEVSAIDGIVNVTLNAPPTSTIVVVVAREDQRYAGAAAIDPSGQPAPVPAGVGAPETHTRVTYTTDVAPLMKGLCTSCHAPGQINPDHPLDTYDAIVNNNFGHTEQVEKCTVTYPSDSAELQACMAAITAEEYMVEPGNPANSGFTQRTIPDANKGTSPVGLLWYGSKGSRFDSHGDRRMPSTTTIADAGTEDASAPVYFDDNPADLQTLFNWVAQGAPR